MKTENPLHKGSILLSSPLLNDPNFRHTAILILEGENDSGHIGLVLNRPLDLSLADVCNMPGNTSNIKIYSGGPVDLQRLFWIHTLGDKIPGSLEILPGLFVGGDYDALMNLFISGADIAKNIRFYLGYSGWEKGQLLNEVQGEAWAVLNNLLDPHILFDHDGDTLWHQLALRLPSSYRHWNIFPSNPNLN